jgi:hypothetical protein
MARRDGGVSDIEAGAMRGFRSAENSENNSEFLRFRSSAAIGGVDLRCRCCALRANSLSARTGNAFRANSEINPPKQRN